MTKRISITLDEDVARILLDSKQDYEDAHKVTLTVSSFIAMLIRTYDQNA